MKQQKGYWLQQLAGEIPILNLIGDFPRPALQTFEGASSFIRLEKDLTQKIKKICSETETTLYMVLLAAFNVLLSKYTAQEEMIVGSPIAGRHHGGLNRIVGMFVNTLAMRNYPVGEKTFKDFLEEVKKNALMAYENQDYPLEELIEELDITRDIARNPLFDVMFTMQNMDLGEVEMEGVVIKPHPLENNISKFDLTLGGTEMENGINLEIEYSTRLFKRETIERLLLHYVNILKQIVLEIDIEIKKIDLIDSQEKQRILAEFNDTQVDFPIKFKIGISPASC